MIKATFNMPNMVFGFDDEKGDKQRMYDLVIDSLAMRQDLVLYNERTITIIPLHVLQQCVIKIEVIR